MIIETDDGTCTVKHSVLGDTYHSLGGAAAEAMHVYINAAFDKAVDIFRDTTPVIRVLEQGFGTGLNALLTMCRAEELNIKVEYYSVELYPLSLDIVESLKYDKVVTSQQYKSFRDIHNAEWGTLTAITPNFSVCKLSGDILEIQLPNECHAVYYDAFAPDTQPELWSEALFSRVYQSMATQAVLSTYSSKGDVKRALRSCGFIVTRAKGALGKHHMLIAQSVKSTETVVKSTETTETR